MSFCKIFLHLSVCNSIFNCTCIWYCFKYNEYIWLILKSFNCYYNYFFIIIVFLFIWGVSSRRHVLSWRHQTGSELVVLLGGCLAAKARGPKQLLLCCASSSSSARTMDGWERETVPNLLGTVPTALLPSFLPSFPWWLNRTCASLRRAPPCLFVVGVYWNALPELRFPAPCALFSCSCAALRCATVLCSVRLGVKVSRGNSSSRGVLLPEISRYVRVHAKSRLCTNREELLSFSVN